MNIVKDSSLDVLLKANPWLQTLKNEIDILESHRKNREWATVAEMKALDEKVLDFLLGIVNLLIADGVKGPALEKVNEEIRVLQYDFLIDDLEDEWELSDGVLELFYEFDEEADLSVVVKKIQKVKDELDEVYVE